MKRTKEQKDSLGEIAIGYDSSLSSQDKVKEGGVKFDTGKPRYDLIPADSLHELAKLYTTGAAKYGDRNWENGVSWGRIFGAMMRHSWAFWRGERFDPDDGQHHMASVAWGALALISYDMREIGDDDRPSRYN